MNPNEKQGALEDLSSIPLERLEYLLKRQETLLTNKTLIRALPDNGVKVKAFADDLRRRIKLRVDENNDPAQILAASFDSKVNIRPGRDSSVKSKNDDNDEVEGGRIFAQQRLRSESGHDLDLAEKLSIEEAETFFDIESEAEANDRIETTGGREVGSKKNVEFTREPSRFKASRVVKSVTNSGNEPTSATELRVALREEAEEKRNILAEIFSEKRSSLSNSQRLDSGSISQQPAKSLFRENAPLRNSSIQSVPKPASIRKLIDNRQRSPSKTGLDPSTRPRTEDAVHPPVNSVFKETKLISLAESVALQEKLKSANEARIFEDAAARLVERLRGQALPTTTTVRSTDDGGDSRRPVVDEASAALELLGPRLAEKAAREALKTRGYGGGGSGGGENLVEGSFVQYREKTDADDDIDDALGRDDDNEENCLDDYA